jgi:hypothetical protein
LDLGRPRSDIGWTSSRLREELFGSWKIPDPILESDVGPDQIWTHLIGEFRSSRIRLPDPGKLRKPLTSPSVSRFWMVLLPNIGYLH